MRHARLIGYVCLVLLAACGKKGQPTHEAPQVSQPMAASLSMLVAPDAHLAGEPNVYLATISGEGIAAPLERGGDIPRPGQLLTLGELPASPAATVELDLYKSTYLNKTKTHTCSATGPVELVAGSTATLSLDCLPVANAEGETPVHVFIKVAAVTLTLNDADPAAILAARDWNADAVFAQLDEQSRRISLRQIAGTLELNVGGDLTYRGPAKDGGLTSLLSGTEVALRLVAGRQLEGAPGDGLLKLTAPAALYEAADGRIAALLPLTLTNASGTVSVQGALLEEAPHSEIVVAEYNVENLFDQTDEPRNSGYGDYRLTPNERGQTSNYGEPVEFEGRTVSYTDVKVAGIRKALLGIAPTGPDIIGLEEIESQQSLDLLFDAVKDLGYLSAEYTTWPEGVAQNAIGCGLLTKFPVKSKLSIPTPAGESATEAGRPILRVELDVLGHSLFVYVNHWKSKGGPESRRKIYADILRADLDALLAADEKADYLILGDLNSEYNERVVIEARHNDTNGLTGLNDVLKAQGDEVAVKNGGDATLHYNLHYELDRAARRSAWYPEFGWSSLNHILVNRNAFDMRGLTYVDNSFQIAHAQMPELSFLFDAAGNTKRWIEVRETPTFTRHEVGGYSDHAPMWARFRVAPRQSDDKIYLYKPGRPDATDRR